MHAMNNIKIIRHFPDCELVKQQDYNDQFKDNNIINAKSSNIYYPKHWGGFSINVLLRKMNIMNQAIVCFTVN
jgi:hypothetical protein